MYCGVGPICAVLSSSSNPLRSMPVPFRVSSSHCSWKSRSSARALLCSAWCWPDSALHFSSAALSSALSSAACASAARCAFSANLALKRGHVRYGLKPGFHLRIQACLKIQFGTKKMSKAATARPRQAQLWRAAARRRRRRPRARRGRARGRRRGTSRRPSPSTGRGL